ncbi:MAG: hypothetical protein NUV42_02025 [Candidatus Yonathbacteria bacterium]|nr:hypothetical protein [Candidatus Yonathbacteria bacterium]
MSKGKYVIIASLGEEGAILKKGDQLYYSWGPAIWEPVEEKNLQRVREGEVKVYIERDRFIPHTPPTPVEKLEDWPKVAAEYEERYKKAHTTVAA